MCNTAYFDALQVGSSWCLCTCASVVVENLMHRQALSLLLVFGHELQREAAAVMLFSRVVAPEMFPAVLGACFADASKLRLQQVVAGRCTSVRVRFNARAAIGPFGLLRFTRARRPVRCAAGSLFFS